MSEETSYLRELEARAQDARFRAEEAARDANEGSPNPEELRDLRRKANMFRVDADAIALELRRAQSESYRNARLAFIRSVVGILSRFISVFTTIAVLSGSLIVSCDAVSEVSARIQ